MSSLRLLFASFVLLVAGCEAVASFDRDKISPMTAPPLANPGRDASISRLDAGVDGGGDGGAADGATDGDVDGDVAGDADLSDADTDAQSDADLSDADVLDGAADGALDAADADSSAAQDGDIEAGVDDEAGTDTGI